MVCHNHHHHCCGNNCCCSCSAGAIYHPPPPPPTCSAADNLLQLLATHLILNPHPPPQQQQQQRQQNHHQSPPTHYSINNLYNQSHLQQKQQFSLIQSLLDRVSALESQLYSSQSPRQSQPPQRQKTTARTTRERKSLRDLAATTIQAHFRRYLVRRSHTLRDLHRLATVKSRVAALRSVFSAVDRADVSLYAASVSDLLRELHSIQSSDPVIQEGRKSVIRELGQIEKFLNKFSAKEVQDYGASNQQRSHLHSSRTAPKKRVNFQNAKKSEIPAEAYFPFEQLMQFGVRMKNFELSGESSGISEEYEEVKEVKELSGEEEDEVEVEESSSRGSAESDGKSGVGGLFQGQKRRWGLSAPSPVQMESRRS